MRSTPVDDAVPGVEVHAQLAEQMLTQDFLARPDFADGAEFLYLGLIGILFVLLLPRLSAGRMAIVAAIFIGIGLAVPWFAFSEYRPAVRSGLSAGDLGGDLRQRHGARLHAHRARARGDPRRLRPLPVARRGRAGRPPSRAAAARRRAARDHRDVHRRARLHAHLRAVRSARADAVHEPLPDADDRPGAEPPRHHRQVHGRRDHGVLERAARRRGPCGARLRYRARHAGAAAASSTRNCARRPRRPGREHIPVAIGIGLNTGQRLGRQFRLRRSASPIPAWATT